MFEAIIITSLALSGISTVQTGIALGQIGNAARISEAATRQSLIKTGTTAGKALRTARYCHADTFVSAYEALIIAKMAPYGEYGRIVIDTALPLGHTKPDLAQAGKSWSCAKANKEYAIALAKIQGGVR